MFTAIQSLPQMRSLDLSVQKTCDGPYKHGNPHNTKPNPILQTAQLARLASSCTGLESLEIAVNMTGTDAHVLAQYAAADAGNSDYGIGPCSLASLQQLSCLMRLDLTALHTDGSGRVVAPKGDDGFQDDHLGELAALSGLQSLTVHGASRLITDKGLQAFTQLTTMTWLRVKIARRAFGVSSAVVPDEESRGCKLELLLRDDLGPDLSRGPVWQHLATRCAQSHLLHPDLAASVVAARAVEGVTTNKEPGELP